MQNGIKQNNRLGRGLAALIGSEYSDKDEASFIEEFFSDDDSKNSPKYNISVPIEQIERNKDNPRYDFDQEQIENLASSIKEHGIIQPIIVREIANNKYAIIAGERRWRAAKLAGLKQIPIIVKNIQENKALELAIIENVQRSDLNPIEEALGYKQLIDLYDYNQEELAYRMGKSRPHITNMLRLLLLPDSVKNFIETKQLSIGHARCLINQENAEELAEIIVRKGLSVRETEDFINANKAKSQAKESSAHKEFEISEIDRSHLAKFEQRMQKALGLRLHIKPKKMGGVVALRYNNIEELIELCKKIENLD